MPDNIFTAGDEDIGFTFDPTPFTSSIDKINSYIISFEQKLGGMGEAIDKIGTKGSSVFRNIFPKKDLLSSSETIYSVFKDIPKSLIVPLSKSYELFKNLMNKIKSEMSTGMGEAIDKNSVFKDIPKSLTVPLSKSYELFKNLMNKIKSEVSTGFKEMGSLSPMKKMKNLFSGMFSKTPKDIAKSTMALTSFGGIGGSIATSLITKVAGIGLAFLSVRKAMQFMPEISRVFEITGDIFMRNLLWPLRKQLLPLLQSLLDWVRDHRIMFVRWGVVIANIFRTLTTLVKGFWESLKGLWENFSSTVRRIFGMTTQSLGDMLNVLLFKFASTLIFIQLLLEPIFKLITAGFVKSLAIGKEFVKGLSIGLGKDFLKVLNGVIDAIVRLGDALGLSNTKAGFMGKIFKSLGVIIGASIIPLLSGLSQFIDMVTFDIEGLQLAMEKFSLWRKGVSSNDPRRIKLDKEIKDLKTGFASRAKERALSVIGNTKDALSALKQIYVPESPLKRTPVPSMNKFSQHNTTTVKDIHINVKSPEEAAQAVQKLSSPRIKESIHEENKYWFTDMLKKSQELRGVR